MSSKSKNDCCADRSILAPPSAYQECPVTFKLMTSQVVQRARPLSSPVWPLRRQRVKKFEQRSLTRELLKQYLNEKQNGYLESGRLREVVGYEKWSL